MSLTETQRGHTHMLDTEHDELSMYEHSIPAERAMQQADMEALEEANHRTRVLTGGSSPNQYRKTLTLPCTLNREIYETVDVETMDITEAFGFDGNQKDIFKALCRDKHSDNYDLDKIVFYSLRNRYNKSKDITHADFWKACVACGVAEYL